MPRLGTSLLIVFNLFSGIVLCVFGLIGLRVDVGAGLLLGLPGFALILNACLVFTPWLWPRYFSIGVNVLGTGLMAWLVWSTWAIARAFENVMALELVLLVFYALFIHQSWVMVKDKRAELRERREGEADLSEDTPAEPGWDEGGRQ